MLGEGVGFSELGPGDPEDYNFFSLFEDVDINSTRMWMLVLYGIIRSNRYRDLVEIGVMRGVSSSILARAAKLNGGELRCVDISLENIENARRRVERNGLLSHVQFVWADSKQANTVPADFVFIDGDHSYEGCKSDWNTWSPHVRLGGLVALHDTADPAVMKAVNEIDRSTWEVLNFPGDCGLALARRVR